MKTLEKFESEIAAGGLASKTFDEELAPGPEEPIPGWICIWPTKPPVDPQIIE